ncbi:putative disease resistance protein RGA3 [Magnolia sinica]|uniref:putative disease resistance protein RGA3 n=1 Tax=Magnolia sinica TaxID=86752 RepID=UPI00265B6F80|nr:putative disease resistance protein RGA3 [Magnolia sinica]
MICLEKLKDVAYDVDDILDEWRTEALRSQADRGDRGGCFNKTNVRKFLSLLSCFNYIQLRHDVGNKINDAWRRLDDLAKEVTSLGLRVDSGERERADGEVRRHEFRDREMGSQVDKSSIVGREHEKDEIIRLLTKGRSREVKEVPVVISIVGVGGLGKTTLAQLAYNDEEVKGHFNMRMWVCVSEDFDVSRITKSMIESATGSTCGLLDLAPLQDRLGGMLHESRFLLVLNDIWSNDGEIWDKLRLPFQAGALGSRNVVTTRREDVAWAMANTHMLRLGVLPNEHCWSLFSRRAFAHRSIEERSELEEIGWGIVKKCGGLPLAAKTIGSAMCSRRTRSKWELVLENEAWKLVYILEGILPASLLSYYDLPPAQKHCFTYFSIFPKDWVIEKDVIVKL